MAGERFVQCENDFCQYRNKIRRVTLPVVGTHVYLVGSLRCVCNFSVRTVEVEGLPEDLYALTDGFGEVDKTVDKDSGKGCKPLT